MSERPWNEGNDEKPFTVSFWSNTPVETDTCTTGFDFSTEKEARMCLADIPTCLKAEGLEDSWIKELNDHPYILLDGPGVHKVTIRQAALLRSQKEAKRYDDESRQEMAMEAGMGLGIHAYNEMMGFDSEEI